MSVDVAVERNKPARKKMRPTLMRDDTARATRAFVAKEGMQEIAGERKREHVPKSTAGKELRDIRQSLHMSMMEMANRLGVLYVTYCSYEYGKVQNINPQVLEDARRMLAASSDGIRALQPFTDRTIQEIVADWAKRLGLRADSVSELAIKIGVDKSTVSRWLSGQIVPRPQQLLFYETRVKALEKLLDPAELKRVSGA
jgi:transcriptional regulator with XRE-family HTH domain